MRFQTKIIVGYAILMFALALALGFGLFHISSAQYEGRERNNVKMAADQIVSQLDERFGQMEASMNYILSDPRILSGIIYLGMAEDTDAISYTFEAKADIRSGINTDYITNNCYRTIVFNRRGDIFTTHALKSRRVVETVDFGTIPELEKADRNKGKPILVTAHADPWGLVEKPQVFSMLRAIQGRNAGYIEVQALVSDLSGLQVPQEQINYMIFINGEELLYTSDASLDISAYRDEAQIAANAVSEKYDITVWAMEDMEVISRANAYNIVTTLVSAFVFFLLSMSFVVLLSKMLTKPLRQLRMAMEHTELSNLSEDVRVDAPNDEILALSMSYRDVLDRLQKSMIKEKRLSILQLQAQFDSLQAQVNPHFIYNVLNILAAKGLSNGDESICEICQSLAAMLRYSTSNVQRYASIEEELRYLEQYFFLLKVRYEHKISFSIEVEEAVQKQIIPKLALQQVVENCINHAFLNSVEQMCVRIEGFLEDGCWYVKIHDNGQGFSGEALHELHKKMESTRRKLLLDRNNMEMEIGGMGLINTYARCLLLYSDSLIFELKNMRGGAEVTIGAALRNGKEEACIG